MANENIELEPLYTKIDKTVKDRAQQFVVDSKKKGNDKTDSLTKLVEEALHEYLINHLK